MVPYQFSEGQQLRRVLGDIDIKTFINAGNECGYLIPEGNHAVCSGYGTWQTGIPDPACLVHNVPAGHHVEGRTGIQNPERAGVDDTLSIAGGSSRDGWLGVATRILPALPECPAEAIKLGARGSLTEQPGIKDEVFTVTDGPEISGMEVHLGFEPTRGWKISAGMPTMRAGAAHHAAADLDVLGDLRVSVTIFRLQGRAFWPNRNVLATPCYYGKVKHCTIQGVPSTAFL